MSTPLQPVITKKGLAAVWNATSTGLSAEITHIALGTSGYTPTNEQTSLRAQAAKYPIAGGERLSDSLIHITALADGPAAFWVREIGFLLADGTLLAVWSHATDALTYKPANTDLLLAYDLSLTALPADSVTIVSSPAGLNLSLAAPLAAMASALVSGQLRSLQQQDQITDLARQQQSVAEQTARQLASLTERLGTAEYRHSLDHEGALAVGIRAVEAALSDQLSSLDLQDQITLLTRQLRLVIEQGDWRDVRLATAERRHEVDHDGLRSMGIAAAEATISTQTQLIKLIHGA
ncbi:phage tail protein [Pseudomonas sp. GD03817]|uniref:phage tail-collar fiber domain-containing protein n=1 Tax=unclassified Pseudomonas TaxID=196821 RepID=UPI00244A3C5F|nr:MULTISPECIES: phage tail protein [unclassified Pseudomonas]MDH1401256.1 phage tail protein [Pseudomonas sp. GD03730]MDH1774920.1 phage tail protein [Pseudomonas sp. GD03817]